MTFFCKYNDGDYCTFNNVTSIEYSQGLILITENEQDTYEVVEDDVKELSLKTWYNNSL